jgi:hypothetical protein
MDALFFKSQIKHYIGQHILMQPSVECVATPQQADDKRTADARELHASSERRHSISERSAETELTSSMP